MLRIFNKIMRPKLWFYPYDMASMSVRGLVDELPARIIRRVNSAYIPRAGDIVVNWGCRATVFPVHLNHVDKVSIATSKTKTFEHLQNAGVSVPKWTRDKERAKEWLQEGHVVARDLDSGSKGKGITVYRKGTAEIKEDHKFYVKYFRKEREFRIHVFQGKIIFRQEKLKTKGLKHVDRYVRSHNRGWCFAFKHFGDSPVPAICDGEAIKAVESIGLDFGAVDIGWNRDGGCAVFEVNTAPGIENSSLQAYVESFKGLL
jgi:hypothetical protein